MSIEANFDGIVGPTHNYSGLSYGNLPSTLNKLSESNPQAAAMQGLEKMWFLASQGIIQGIIPPQERPHIPTLRRLGFAGTDETILADVFQHHNELLVAVSSASSMWAANSVTVAPSPDSNDHHVHITPANLQSKFHRSIETPMTSKIFAAIFPDPIYFAHHDALPPSTYFGDEGAANHTRFCRKYGEPGVQLFVYGRSAFKPNPNAPRQFPARQTVESSESIARSHQLNPKSVIFAQQSPQAIDAGVFHNDVISVGNRNVFFYHENAFIGTQVIINDIQKKVRTICETDMIFIKVPEKKVPLKDAISSYLFNSQLISLPDGTTVLIAPTECQSTPTVHQMLEEITKDAANPIKYIHYLNVRESMKNGGGPACLRQRIVLNENEMDSVNQHFLLTEHLYGKLKEWIHKHYRDRLTPSDLRDPKLLNESRQALDELTKILHLGSFYEFQK